MTSDSTTVVGIGGGIQRIVFALGIGLNMLWSASVMELSHFAWCIGLVTKQHKEGFCLRLAQACWRIAFFFSPWIQLRPASDSDFRTVCNEISNDMGTDTIPRPLMVLGNHSSFFDVVLFTITMPARMMCRFRTYMDSHLFKTPVLASFCKSIGHFPVPFMSDSDGNFKVNKKQMEVVEQQVNEYLRTGGWLCFYPEGQTNKNPDTLLPFRFGGMKKALELDTRVAFFVSAGTTNVWPRKNLIGGFPGRVIYSMLNVAPQGVRAYVTALRKEGLPDEERTLPDEQLIALHFRRIMQAEYDKLKTQIATVTSLKK